MNKRLIVILIGSAVIIALLTGAVLIIGSITKKPNSFEPIPTASGGRIVAVDNIAATVPLDAYGVSTADAVFGYESKYGYSIRYNNKYIVDFGVNEYDFSIRNADNTVTVSIKQMSIDDGIVAITTKEEWDALMGSMLGESANFNRTKINNMEALVAEYNVSAGENMQTNILYAMLIGDSYIYNYIYSASSGASPTEAQQIGAVLYTMEKIPLQQ